MLARPTAIFPSALTRVRINAACPLILYTNTFSRHPHYRHRNSIEKINKTHKIAIFEQTLPTSARHA